MSVVDQVKAAKNPQEAMLVIAAALDELLSRQPTPPANDGWGEWGEPEPAALELVRAEYSDDGGTTTTFTITGDAHKKVKRAEFAEAFIRPAFGRADLESGEWHPNEEVVDAFVNAGPLWLYAYDRDYVMSLSQDAKVQLIEDVFEDNKEEGAAFGRDVMKDQSAGQAPARWSEAQVAD